MFQWILLNLCNVACDASDVSLAAQASANIRPPGLAVQGGGGGGEQKLRQEK